MKLTVYKMDGNRASSVTVNKNVFGIDPNEAVVHRAVLAELTNSRQGTSSSKNRSKVRGGGRKPFKQKGRGVARAGTIRSPLWVGGGTVFGPEPRNYKYKLPKKVKQLARRSVLSEKAKNNGIMIVEELKLDQPKTKELVKILSDLNISENKILILLEEVDENIKLAVRNIPQVSLKKVDHAGTYDLLNCDTVLISKTGLELLNETMAVD